MNESRVLIIAEAGVNHNGDMGLARQLIEVAADAGADLVKFQTFSAERLATSQARKADYQTATTDAQETQFSMLKRLELTHEMHLELMAHCRQCGIGFFSSGFDVQSVDYLASLGLDRFKVPSGEITNLPYLRHIGTLGKPVILSTGMATLGEVEAAVDVLAVAGVARGELVLLHCNTEYPTPFQDVNLRAMVTMGNALGVAYGYSDHTPGIEVSVAAVALGAQVIEKHFTIDRSLAGPDHRASLEPQELRLLVQAIRHTELAMGGDGIKRPSPSERRNLGVARKSLVAAVAIRRGDVLTSKNVTTKRPGTGLSPMVWDSVMGRVAIKDFEPDELIVI